MKEIEIDELKAIQLNILKQVHKFCVENGLEYSLDSGTLIGAVRHGGYIPWDDDIDIIMNRPNYNKFLNIFNGKYSNLYVISPELNNHFYAPYANICDNRTLLKEDLVSHNGIHIGVKIDLFPIDGVPTDYNIFIKEFYKIKHYNAIMSAKRSYFKRIRTLTSKSALALIYRKIFYSPIHYSHIQLCHRALVTNHPYENSEYASQWAFNAIPLHLEKRIFEEYMKIKFEGEEFLCIKDFDKYLRSYYGDYMILPPEEQRIPHHGFSAYWL